MPWILCGPGAPPDRTAESAGSTATTSAPGRRSLSTSPTPVSVPPVPTPATNASTSPPVSAQISSAVVSRCTSGLAGFSNCCGTKASSPSAASSSALATAPRIPSAPGVSTRRAPNALRIVRRSMLMVSGIVSTMS